MPAMLTHEPRDNPAWAAHEANRRLGAERAVNDPVRLARAVRAVRLALNRGVITFDDLLRGPDTTP